MRHLHADDLVSATPADRRPDLGAAVPGPGGGFDLNGGKAGDDVVETTYPDSLTVNGGKGTDTLVLHWAADSNNVIVNLSADAGAGGYDGTISDSAHSATVQFTSFERFNITSGDGADALYGGAGDDSLNGRGGADLMNGGAGNDTYHVDNTQDVLIEAEGGGTDTVISSIDFTLQDDFENLAFNGPDRRNGVGNGADNVLTANDAGDSLRGLNGADTLIGGAGADTLAGGPGLDVLMGGGGNDTYYVLEEYLNGPRDTVPDQVFEAADGGVDTVYVDRSYEQYQLPDNVENATAATRDQDLIGNDLDNVLQGAGAKHGGTLIGGAGDDTLIDGYSMQGGVGDDTYVIDHVRSSYFAVYELAGEGTDTIVAYVSATLAANVENLVLEKGAQVGTGNELNNVLTGNGQANTLEGAAGGDTLDGAGGSDVASYVHAASAVTVDLTITDAQRTKGAGADTLISIEGLTGSTYDDKLVGNADANVLSGNAGADTLLGGDAADTLSGGDGNDSLVGGDGPDSLSGGAGSDTLVGGAGADHLIGQSADTFIYLSDQDSTLDKTDTLDLGGNDTIDLSAIDADTTQAGDQAFHRVAALDGQAGELILVQNGSGQTLLEGDVNGDGQADLYAVISGSHTDFNNFVL